MSHTCECATHVYSSCNARAIEWSPTRMKGSHHAHINESCNMNEAGNTCKGVVSHIYECATPHAYECVVLHTYKQVQPHTHASSNTHLDQSSHVYFPSPHHPPPLSHPLPRSLSLTLSLSCLLSLSRSLSPLSLSLSHVHRHKKATSRPGESPLSSSFSIFVSLSLFHTHMRQHP